MVLLDVAGEHLLVATGEARGHCPDITQLNDAGVQYWEILRREEGLKATLEAARRETGLSMRELLPRVLGYAEKLEKAGYLLEEDA